MLLTSPSSRCNRFPHMGIAVDRVDKAYAMSVPGGEVAQRVANVLERRPEVLASVAGDQDDARAVGESRPELWRAASPAPSHPGCARPNAGHRSRISRSPRCARRVPSRNRFIPCASGRAKCKIGDRPNHWRFDLFGKGLPLVVGTQTGLQWPTRTRA